MFIESICFIMTLNLEDLKHHILKKIHFFLKEKKDIVSESLKLLLTQFFVSLWVLRRKISQVTI